MSNNKERVRRISLDDKDRILLKNAQELHDKTIKEINTIHAVVENITQQYHQFAITFESVRPLFETIQTDIQTVEDMKRELDYYKSSEYMFKVLLNYEISEDGKDNQIIRKKKFRAREGKKK